MIQCNTNTGKATPLIFPCGVSQISPMGQKLRYHISLHPLQGQSYETRELASAVLNSHSPARTSRPRRFNNTTNLVVLLMVTDTCLSDNPLPSGCQDSLWSTEKRVLAAVPAPLSSGPLRADCGRCQQL